MWRWLTLPLLSWPPSAQGGSESITSSARHFACSMRLSPSPWSTDITSLPRLLRSQQLFEFSVFLRRAGRHTHASTYDQCHADITAACSGRRDSSVQVRG
jgi:hypothetical protein